MKTPTDVFNYMKIILAHVEDIKNHLAVTGEVSGDDWVFGKKPKDVFQKTVEMFELLREISLATKARAVVIPGIPDEVLPRDIYYNATSATRHLVAIKRRLGIEDKTIPAKAAVRISPSHVYRETAAIVEELKLLRDALAD